MTVINLIPPEVLTRRELRWRMRVWITRVGCSVVLFAVLYVGILNVVSGGQAEILRIAERHRLLEEKLQRAQSLIHERDRLARRQAVIASIRDDRPAGRVLEVLGELLPPASYLNYLNLDRCASSPGAKGRDTDACVAVLDLRGRASNHPEVGKIIHRLTACGLFARVDLVSAQEGSASDGKAGVDFQLICTFKTRAEEAVASLGSGT